MSRHPRIGQSVEPWHKKSAAHRFPHHGRLGTVVVAGKGPGPVNALVRMEETGTLVVVPRGNLREPMTVNEMSLFRGC
jgi:hypothetical protein